jgi:hypothetical protein
MKCRRPAANDVAAGMQHVVGDHPPHGLRARRGRAQQYAGCGGN